MDDLFVRYAALEVLVRRLAAELESISPGAIDRLGGTAQTGPESDPGYAALLGDIDDHVSRLLAKARNDAVKRGRG